MHPNTRNIKLQWLAGCLFIGLLAGGCQKDRSCEGCLSGAGNQIPVARAGADQVVSLPRDSVLLNGRASSDPDGKLVRYQWRKIEGPASGTLAQPDSVTTTALSLTESTYLFELTVTDDKGARSADTVQITVRPRSGANQPPVALAGADQTLTLPVNATLLDGAASYDRDGKIVSYQWTKVEGPSLYSLDHPAGATTGITNLLPGEYLFELVVTDNEGLSGRDTVQVSVRADASTGSSCNAGSRPLVQVRLIPVGQLSLPRNDVAVAAAGNKLLFAGGWVAPNTKVTRVDIYDLGTGRWTTAELPGPGSGLATASVGNKVLLAGGSNGNSGSSRVDIYDAVTNKWSAAALSTGRFALVGAAAGDKAVFAGGLMYFGVYRNVVDIYDETTRSWSATTLSNRSGTGTVGIATAVLGSKVYFAGEASDWLANGYGSYSSTINIYDATTGNWSVGALKQKRGFMAGIGVGNKLYWAGGVVHPAPDAFTNEVEIMDATTGTSTFGCLFQPNAFFSAVRKDNFIVFFTGKGREKNKFDLYDTASDTWAIGVLPQSIEGASVISVNNTIYVAGGIVGGSLSGQLWRLEF